MNDRDIRSILLSGETIPNGYSYNEEDIMKVLVTYLKKREKAIYHELDKPTRRYTPETFHRLRVEIKKLYALFELINFCTKKFKRKKTFIPFKRIFEQAGKVREIQLEEAMLARYFPAPELHSYRTILRKQKASERKIFTSLSNTYFPAKLWKSYHKMQSILSRLNKNKVKRYLQKKRKKINKLLQRPALEKQQVHSLRKVLKNYQFIMKSLNLDTRKMLVRRKSDLTEILGAWHDRQVVMRHLDKALNADQIKPQELKQVYKIKTEIATESEEVLQTIRKALPPAAAIFSKSK